MSRHPCRGGRPQLCSSSSAGSASYQGISGATSPVYHRPHDPFLSDQKSFRKKPNENNVPNHNYYNFHQQPCCPPKDSIADTHSYQYLNDDEKSCGIVDFSDDSSYYEYQRGFEKRCQTYSEYESDFPIPHQLVNKSKAPFQKQELRYQSSRSSSNPHSHGFRDSHLINQDGLRGLDRVYPEAPLTRNVTEDFQQELLTRRNEIERIPERANSPESLGVSSAIVDGCGGHCVAFENVCSYILQIFFIMGILIGVSLCLAGTVLRRTKSKDLQVLVYIGALSAMVCMLLLAVQCRVRRQLRMRKRAIRATHTTAIPLGDIRPQHQPLITQNANLRIEERPVIIPINVQNQEDQQGVPWWRRNDLSGNHRI